MIGTVGQARILSWRMNMDACTCLILAGADQDYSWRHNNVEPGMIGTAPGHLGQHLIFSIYHIIIPLPLLISLSLVPGNPCQPIVNRYSFRYAALRRCLSRLRRYSCLFATSRARRWRLALRIPRAPWRLGGSKSQDRIFCAPLPWSRDDPPERLCVSTH